VGIHALLPELQTQQAEERKAARAFETEVEAARPSGRRLALFEHDAGPARETGATPG